MSKEITTEILINASPEKVWSVFADFDNYRNWNPFIISIEGEIQKGKTIKARIEPPEGRGMTFKPSILSITPEKKLVWLGHLLFPGLFDGEHKFELFDHENGSTTFRQSEKFRGILVPLFKKIIDYNTRLGFELMNAKLKEEVEN